MRPTHTATLTVLLACTLAMPWARSASADQTNAAWWYQRAISRLSALPSKPLSDAIDWASDPVSAPSPEIRELLARAQSLLADFRRGAAQAGSDFGHDYSQGFELMLPALAPLRRIAHLNRIDGMVALHDGDHARAVRAAEGMLRLSAHLPEDEIMISSLVGAAVYTMADGFIESCLGRGAISADDARRLAAAMDGLPDRDPFGMVESLAREQSVAVDWLSTLRDEDEAWPERMASYFSDDDPETAEALASLDADAFSAALGQYDAAMSHVVEAFSLDDRAAGAAALAPLLAEIERGEHGPLVQLFMPAVGMLLSRLEQMEAAVRARREHLTALAEGRRDPSDEVNAAAEYLEAGRLLHACDAETFAALMQSDVPLETVEARQAWDALHALLESASRRRRCDFNAILTNRPFIASPEGPGLRACLLALHAAAARPPVAAADAAQRPVAPDLHAAALRMIAHLSGDTAITSALIATEALAGTLPAVTRLHDTGALDGDAKSVLAAAIRRIPRADPCAHIRAGQSLRQGLGVRLHTLRLHSAALAGRSADMRRSAEPLRETQDAAAAIGCLLDLVDAHADPSERIRESRDGTLTRLGALLDQDAVDALAALASPELHQSPSLLLALIEGADPPLPRPARLDGRSAEVRSLLRRLSRLVRTAEDEEGEDDESADREASLQPIDAGQAAGHAPDTP